MQRKGNLYIKQKKIETLKLTYYEFPYLQLDNLKKRYEYGQNVSNKNRFRILERKLINNLESLKDGVMND